jgi:hypothetical protein
MARLVRWLGKLVLACLCPAASSISRFDPKLDHDRKVAGRDVDGTDQMEMYCTLP